MTGCIKTIVSQHQLTIIHVLHLFVVEVIGAEIKYFTDIVPPIVITDDINSNIYIA